MTQTGLIDYADASPDARAVFDEIKAARSVADVNNFWKALAQDPATLRRTWDSVRQVMAPGALDVLTKEMLYVAVSIAGNCPYCIRSHTAAAFRAGMTPAMLQELLAVIAMAAETNRLATGYGVPIDAGFDRPAFAAPSTPPP